MGNQKNKRNFTTKQFHKMLRFSNRFARIALKGRPSTARSLFTLPELPYSLEKGLNPAISSQALDLHYNRHHLTYVNNANKLVSGTPYESMELEDVIRDTANKQEHAGLYNQVAQIWNHSSFWKCMAPSPAAPSQALKDGWPCTLARSISSRRTFRSRPWACLARA